MKNKLNQNNDTSIDKKNAIDTSKTSITGEHSPSFILFDEFYKNYFKYEPQIGINCKQPKSHIHPKEKN